MASARNLQPQLVTAASLPAPVARSGGRKRLVGLFLCLTACAKAPAPSWQVTNGFIRDPSGRAVILRGANVSGSQKAKPYLDNKTIADYQRMRDQWGFNSMRFVMTWAAIEPQQGMFDETYLDGVDERMGWADQLGLSVVLDMHQDVYGEGFGFDGAASWTCAASNYAGFVPVSPWSANEFTPQVGACFDALYQPGPTQQQFVGAWQHVAQRLAGHPSIIGFDILNEPEWADYNTTSFEQTALQPLYEKVIAAVREQAPHWFAFVEPGTTLYYYGIPSGLQPFPYPGIVYAPHSYNDLAEGGGAFPNTPEATGALLTYAAAQNQKAQELHAALWMGEYGGATSTDPNVTLYMKTQYDAFGAVAGSSAYWSDDEDTGGYGIVDDQGNEKPALTTALVLPYPSRVAGDPVSYAYDQDTSTFTFVYKPDTTLSQPTEIIVPSRLYTNGFQVSCGGCQWTKTSAGLNINRAGSGSPLTVTLH